MNEPYFLILFVDFVFMAGKIKIKLNMFQCQCSTADTLKMNILTDDELPLSLRIDFGDRNAQSHCLEPRQTSFYM